MLLFSLQAFEEEPQDVVISQKNSFCSYSDEIINLCEHYLNLRRSKCNFLEEPDEPTIAEKTFHLSKRWAKGCKCQSTEESVDLGDNFYPKNVKTRKCLKTGCCNDSKTECQEVKYTVRVLRTREPEEKVQHDLHPLLSLHWRSESVEVIAACVCLMRTTFI